MHRANYLCENGWYYVEDSVTSNRFEEVFIGRNGGNLREHRVIRRMVQGSPSENHKAIPRAEVNILENAMRQQRNRLNQKMGW